MEMLYLSTTAARDAIRHRRQFNIIHVPTGLKLDLIQRKTTEFGTIDITHGQRLKSDGHYDAWFASPENIVIMKLRYFQEGGSEKHLRDIASIVQIQGKLIDQRYIAEWAKKLGVMTEWKLICERMQELESSE